MISVRLPDEHDLDRLLTWRNRDDVRAASLDQDPIQADQHQAWFSRLLQERHGELGIVCHDTRAVGVIQLQQLDLDASEATWGCHLGEVDLPPGFGATLPILGIALGLRGWDLAQLNAEVIETNRNMLGIHRRLAIRRIEPDAGTSQSSDTATGDSQIPAVRYQVRQDELTAILDRAERLFPRSLSESLTTAIAAFDTWRDR